ncbi:MAG: haloacid dehalogenase-like hydrolase [Bacteroidales bacterium]|nr:haloacid dehalogenase-like hydrolase [Bacteroidales bacterium]
MNRKGKPIVALIYDFDGTLAPGNMQEYSFINAVGMGKEEFWGETHKMSQGQDADGILIYMLFMLQEAKKKGLSITRESLRQFGKDIHFFKVVESWFQRINKIGLKEGVIVEHYINSSGLLEIMEGSRIAKEFKTIFASSYYYSKKGNAMWPAAAVNYTNKTQFLFKINKGILNIHDSEEVNSSVPEDEKRVAFSNMIYFGDGETDVPCMKLTRQLGGSSIAVYDPGRKEKKKIADLLLSQKRVNYSCPADYSRGSKIEEIVTKIIRKIVADDQLAKLSSE